MSGEVGGAGNQHQVRWVRLGTSIRGGGAGDQCRVKWGEVNKLIVDKLNQT